MYKSNTKHILYLNIGRTIYVYTPSLHGAGNINMYWIITLSEFLMNANSSYLSLYKSLQFSTVTHSTLALYHQRCLTVETRRQETSIVYIYIALGLLTGGTSVAPAKHLFVDESPFNKGIFAPLKSIY